LKTTIACPSHILRVILRQTDLDESTVHVRYMKFRRQYPTGFIGPSVFKELCASVLSREECDSFVDMVFLLYGRNRKGWSTRLIGFREVILATVNISNLDDPEKVLRWIFRVHDFNGTGAVPVSKLGSMIDMILG
jgi:Ca2+-binding EF-hand superfamily protein